jgi:ABC-type Co2+ transport system permease subunit
MGQGPAGNASLGLKVVVVILGMALFWFGKWPEEFNRLPLVTRILLTLAEGAVLAALVWYFTRRHP